MSKEILPVEPQRDSDGHWWHPDIDWGEDEVPASHILSKYGLKECYTYMETDALDLYEKYCDSDSPDISNWSPQCPNKDDGWFLVGIADSEEGPVAVWAKKLTLEETLDELSKIGRFTISNCGNKDLWFCIIYREHCTDGGRSVGSFDHASPLEAATECLKRYKESVK